MSGPSPVLRAEGVAKQFAGQPVLDGVDLELVPGEKLGISGRSGAGKSTLLHVLAGLESVDGGVIEAGGVRVDQLDERGRTDYRREHVGFVFQDYNLLPLLTVRENLLFPMVLAERHDAERIENIAQAVGIHPLLDRFPETLSGGEAQRVAVARAVAHRPRLVFADEPTAALDIDNAEAVLGLLIELCEQSGSALVVVSHDLDLVRRLDRRAELVEGRLQIA